MQTTGRACSAAGRGHDVASATQWGALLTGTVWPMCILYVALRIMEWHLPSYPTVSMPCYPKIQPCLCRSVLSSNPCLARCTCCMCTHAPCLNHSGLLHHPPLDCCHMSVHPSVCLSVCEMTKVPIHLALHCPTSRLPPLFQETSVSLSLMVSVPLHHGPVALQWRLANPWRPSFPPGYRVVDVSCCSVHEYYRRLEGD